ncbi:hypothetical protein IWQ60_005875 [Tieghemiomyces parasiticus]|uniref:RRM domain-containing protein n=1 Tax=Tieghemiomyces parasiticus TaxID=78921 RepID=A0A9W8A8C2_9FUNG|nr:hypothetical protein IWQ60_005875 [Tieghemiomyces parasiticus]
MSNLLDQSLDAIVDEDMKKSRRGRHSQARSNTRTGGKRSNGPRRHQPYATTAAATPFVAPTVPTQLTTIASRRNPINTQLTRKILISNLRYNVTKEDLLELFGQMGVLSVQLMCGPDGRSLGTATAVFRRGEDAILAVETYNRVTLDSRPMRLELVQSPTQLSAVSAATPVIPSATYHPAGMPMVPMYGGMNNAGGPMRVNRPNHRSQQQQSRRSAGGDGASRGRNSRPPVPTTASLDAEMDEYMAARD